MIITIKQQLKERKRPDQARTVFVSFSLSILSQHRINRTAKTTIPKGKLKRKIYVSDVMQISPFGIPSREKEK